MSTVLTPISSERALWAVESGRVLRYHAAPTVQPQTIGLHSWGVALIVMYLVGEEGHPGTSTAKLMRAALLHDSPELHTGDIPFGVKRRSPEMKALLTEMEEEAYATLTFPMPGLNAAEEAVLKIADTLEGLVWCKKCEPVPIVLPRWQVSLEKAHEKFAPLLGPDIIARSVAFANNINYVPN